MIGDQTYPLSRRTGGTLRYKNIYSSSFGYTETHKVVAAGSATAILAATAANLGTTKTVIDGITQPDVPRALTVKPGGTAGDILDSAVVVHGVNVEGKPISEIFETVAGDTTLLTGSKAFKQVTSIVLPGGQGAGATFSVGTSNKLGIRHRLYKNNTTVKVYQDTSVDYPHVLALQTAPTVVASGDQVELNLVTPATTPDGTTFLTICYVFDNWALEPVYDEPAYSTSTSTSSTSSSTSTTTATTTSTSSTSSTSSSTSASSTSSTSISTSSTSTSTTTVP